MSEDNFSVVQQCENALTWKDSPIHHSIEINSRAPQLASSSQQAIERNKIFDVDVHPTIIDTVKNSILVNIRNEFKDAVKEAISEGMITLEENLRQIIQPSIGKDKKFKDSHDDDNVDQLDEDSDSDDDDDNVDKVDADSDSDDNVDKLDEDSDSDEDGDHRSDSDEDGDHRSDSDNDVKFKRTKRKNKIDGEGGYPSGYEPEDLSYITLVLNRSSMRKYVTSIFYDALCIVHGYLPPRKLIKGNEYESTLRVGNIHYITKTFFRIIWDKGFRIINLPYALPFPTSLQAKNWPTPQSLSMPVILTLVRQYCHPDPKRRLQFICRNDDESRMPFITRPMDSMGNAAPDSLDFHSKTPPRTAFLAHQCRCPLHLGKSNYWERFTPQKDKRKKHDTLKKHGSPSKPSTRRSNPLVGPPSILLPTITTRTLKRATTLSDLEDRESSLTKRFKNSIQNTPATPSPSVSKPNIDKSSAASIAITSLQWHSNSDVLIWATEITRKFKSSLKKEITEQQRNRMYKGMINMMTSIFSNTKPLPWTSFSSLSNHAKSVIKLVTANPLKFSIDGLTLWLLTAIHIMEKYPHTLAPDDINDIQNLINALSAHNIDDSTLKAIRDSLLKIMEDNLFDVPENV